MAQKFKNSAQREEQLKKLEDDILWDVVIAGSSPAGLGIAVDAAARGFSVLLLQMEDFASGAAGNSSKIIEPDLNMLKNPKNWGHFRDELTERKLLAGNAPDQTEPIDLIIPCYESFRSEAWFGLMSAVNMAGPAGHALGAVSWMSAEDIIRKMPGIKPEGLTSGVRTTALKIKDARLAISLVKTAISHGATVANYVEVTSISRDKKGLINSLTAKDLVTGKDYTIRTRMLFNCAGRSADKIRQLVDPKVTPGITYLEAPRIAVDPNMFEGKAAAFLPASSELPRFLCIPGELRSTVLMGPTPVKNCQTAEKEKSPIELLLDRARKVMLFAPTAAMVKAYYVEECAIWAPYGLKSWPQPRTAEIIPEFQNMITVVGARWGNYRITADEAIAAAVDCGLMYKRPCTTEYLSLAREPDFNREEICAEVLKEEKITPAVIEYAKYCHDNEFAVSAEDVLLRRLRMGQISQTLTPKLIEELAQSEVFS